MLTDNLIGDSSGSAVTSSNASSVQSVLTLTVTDTPKYKVIYDGNGAESGIVPTDSRLYGNGVRVDALDGSHLRKSGKEFGGWSLTSTGTAPVASISIANGDVNLYAIWNATTAPVVPIVPQHKNSRRYRIHGIGGLFFRG